MLGRKTEEAGLKNQKCYPICRRTLQRLRMLQWCPQPICFCTSPLVQWQTLLSHNYVVRNNAEGRIPAEKVQSHGTLCTSFCRHFPPAFKSNMKLHRYETAWISFLVQPLLARELQHIICAPLWKLHRYETAWNLFSCTAASGSGTSTRSCVSYSFKFSARKFRCGGGYNWGALCAVWKR